jgi:hypothetical protein
MFESKITEDNRQALAVGQANSTRSEIFARLRALPRLLLATCWQSPLVRCNQNDLYLNAGGARGALRGSIIGADSACMKSFSKPAVEMVLTPFYLVSTSCCFQSHCLLKTS